MSPPIESPSAPSLRTSTPPLSPSAPSFCASTGKVSTDGAVNSRPNGLVTKPTKKDTLTELKATLERLGMDSHGKKETLYKRLLAAYIRQTEEAEAAMQSSTAAARAAEMQASGALPDTLRQPYLSYLCFDVEATCMSGKGQFDYPNEIIEFPVVLMQWVYDVETDDEDDALASEPPRPRRRHRVNGRLEKVDTFHTYVRPTWRPKLSAFCTNLTGIQQSTVDAAPTFPEVLVMLEDWLRSWGLLENDELQNAMWVTDGPWDLQDFVPKQLHITPPRPPRYPKYFIGPYLNLKAAVRTVVAEEKRRAALGNPLNLSRITTSRHTRFQRQAPPPMTITGQLEALGIGEFKGRQHSGIDDATNIARILRAVADRGVLIESNGNLPSAKNVKTWHWMGNPGEVLWTTPADGDGSPTEGSEPAIEAGLIRLALDDLSPGAEAKHAHRTATAQRALRAICATT